MDKKTRSVTDDQIKRGIREESKEHPWLTPTEVKRLVLDHTNHHPYMYRK
jgi:hypothetical protein